MTSFCCLCLLCTVKYISFLLKFHGVCLLGCAATAGSNIPMKNLLGKSEQ